MFDASSSRVLIGALLFVSIALVLYGVLFLISGLDRFDSAARTQESVRVITP